ncbi:ThiF family adenylyltransferase [Evansella halocellulosilytica]|uniref:ThiF family adenylyltransferase n=1 Tax=Evansella halocellulosilytica TaxID=2011013 RepID=UPI000BB92E7F|nr:ThiF family adenylyltransferase [Evansella halocellulosilytica]
MKFWFLSDTRRLTKEKDEIEKLQSTATWLEGTEWTLENGLALIAKIKAHGNLYEVKLTYPPFFPSTPPIVTPMEDGAHWSTHQYENGSLCLEWGPDNWYPSVTGANMLESAYRLIYKENPLGETVEKNLVISRHFLTEGQNLRNKAFRLYVEPEFLNIISNLQDHYMGNIKFTFVFGNEDTAILHVLELEHKEGKAWKNSSLPEDFKSNYELTGVLLKSNLSSTEIRNMKTVTQWKQHYDLEVVTPLSDTILIIAMDNENNPHVLMNGTNKEKLFSIPLVTEEPKGRLPNHLVGLNEKRIGIVGLGSLGSKIALSLARTGARKFYLVDDDVFLPGNMIRHTLDWKSVASHKVDAVKNQLMNISTAVNVAVSKINLSGQEATTSLNTVLSKLGNCDLIIDATANPRAFNFLSAVRTTYEKPMVWGEVFAGGIGGLIARSRPKADPDALTMRKGFNGYTMQLPEFEFKILDLYATEDQQEEVMIASDADVSIIAGHLTRFALDTVLQPDQSIYPYSMYLIGLSNSWIFEAPFDTHPIHINHLTDETETVENEEERNETIDFIASLLEKSDD